MSIYTSQGTIKIQHGFDPTDGRISRTTIYFVPDKDYSIKHRNKNYAVFVPQSCKNPIMRKYNPDEGRGVDMDATEIDCTGDISSAHMHQNKVQVVVRVTLKSGRISGAVRDIGEATAGTAKDQKVEEIWNVGESAQDFKFIRIVPPE